MNTSTPDPFGSPKRKLARAQKDFRDLRDGINRHLAEKQYVHVIEPDADGIHETHKIKATTLPPDELTDLTYDIIDSLRSALDQSIYPIAAACPDAREDRAHFLIADTADDFENALRGNCKGLPDEIVTLLRSFKPYERGNKIIWALNRIRRQGYHRLIIPIGVYSGKTKVRHLRMGDGSEFYFPRWNTEKSEIVLARTPVGAKPDYDIQLRFVIAFGDVEAVARKPILDFLDFAAGHVESIILALEAESRRIGLIT